MTEEINHWRRFAAYFRPDRSRLVIAGGLLVVTQVTAILKPWPLARFLDELAAPRLTPAGEADPGRMVYLGWLVMAMLGVHLVHEALKAILNLTTIQIGLSGLARVRITVFEGLLRMSLRALHRMPAGDVIFRATWDTCSFQTLFQQGIVAFVTSVLHLALMSAVMWQLDRRLACAALMIVPPLLILLQRFTRRINERSLAAQAADSRIAAHVQQAVSNLPVLQSFTRESVLTQEFGADAQRALDSRRLQHRKELAYLASVACLFATGTAVTLWFGGQEVLAGRLTLGELFIFLAYLAQFYEPLNQLSNVGTTFAQTRAGTQRVLEFLDGIEAVPNGSRQFPLKAGTRLASVGSDRDLRTPLISCKSVNFGYQPSRLILRSLSFEVFPGETVALIGPSGSGKSTILHLLLRFYDPQAGKVFILDTDLRDFELTSLRTNLAWVPQEPLILPGTIAENLAVGRPAATRKEIEEAARAALAEEFILRLPEAYDSVIGDGGVRMSVGEKQRLNLARAFLKDAPILLLDEPTSALDSASEDLVLEAIVRLRSNRSVVLVSHQPRTIALADRVLLLEEGRIARSFSSSEYLRGTRR